MRTSAQRSDTVPWYRQFHVWLLIAFPALSVVGGFTTLWLAVSTDDGLVVDDYYRQGLEINQVLERDRAASASALTADLQMEEERGRLRVILGAAEGFHPPRRLTVSFLHRTRSGLDRIVVLESTDPMLYEGLAPELAEGNWDVLIEADNWRLLNSLSVRR